MITSYHPKSTSPARLRIEERAREIAAVRRIPLLGRGPSIAARQRRILASIRAFTAQCDLEATVKRIEAALAGPLPVEIPEPPPAELAASRPTMRRILNEVAKAYGVGTADILSSRRHKSLCIVRHECFYRCRNETLHSLSQIGAFFHKDHTTVLHGIRKHEARLKAAGEGG